MINVFIIKIDIFIISKNSVPTNVETSFLKIKFQVVLICIAAALAAPSPEPKPEEKSESDSTLHLQKRQAGAGPSPKPYSDALNYFNNYGSWPSGYTQHYSLLNYNGLNPVFFNPYYRL